MYQTIVGIDGMACTMCEAHVCEAVKKAFPVKKARASHRRGQLELLTDLPVAEPALRAALAPTGYDVTSFDCKPFEKKSLWSKLFG